MKANELMIGDWILMDGHKLRVTKLTADRDYDNCEPIPLSVEILEKNGWSVDNGYLIRIMSPQYYDCSYDNRLNMFHMHGKVCIDGEFLFVHELQHALRLCGLTELADNFKIE